MSIRSLLARRLGGQPLEASEAEALMDGWLAGSVSDALSGALLVALAPLALTPNELSAMARSLQRACGAEATDLPVLVDTCGTGGDGLGTFNISTAVAFVVAACGVPVAKHGARSATSRVGSADVLEYLGLDLTGNRELALQTLAEVGITFLFAPGWHPALKAVAPVRRELGIRTLFNLLGPLVNPLVPTVQVLGVYHPDLVALLAHTLRDLGREHYIVVHGAPGLDECSLCGPTRYAIGDSTRVTEGILEPEALGLALVPPEALCGGNVEENAAILKAVLQGKGTLPQEQIVALNAAAALLVSGVADTWEAGMSLAQGCLADGAPWYKFEQLARFRA